MSKKKIAIIVGVSLVVVIAVVTIVGSKKNILGTKDVDVRVVEEADIYTEGTTDEQEEEQEVEDSTSEEEQSDVTDTIEDEVSERPLTDGKEDEVSSKGNKFISDNMVVSKEEENSKQYKNVRLGSLSESAFCTKEGFEEFLKVVKYDGGNLVSLEKADEQTYFATFEKCQLSYSFNANMMTIVYGTIDTD